MKRIRKLIISLILIISIIGISSCAFLDFILSDELYTVTFENYGKGIKPKNLEDVLELPEELPILEEKGYEFLGWYYDETFIIEALPNDLVIEDTTLYACWVEGMYDITYNCNGHGNSVPKTTGINKILNLPTLTEVGYTFIGWYYDADFKQEAKVNDKIYNDITLYAKWEQNGNEIHFYEYDGCEPKVLKVEIDEEVTILNYTPKVGYTFVGWNTKADGTGKSYQVGDKVKELSTGEDVDLYGIWKVNEYTVTFKLNNGQNNIIQTLHYGDKVSPISNPIKEGYKFIGWYLDDKLFDFENDCLKDFNIVLEAKYIKEVSIKFISFDEEYKVIKGYETEEIRENIINPTKDGYTFVGWYLDAEYKQEYDLKIFPDKNINVYAKWDSKKYNVTFDLNNGDVNVVKEFKYNEKITPIDEPSKSNYKFVGWYLEEELFDFENTHMPSKNIILTAKYLKRVDIVFITSNTIYEKLSGYETEDIETVIIEPSKEGYRFAGWYLDADFKQEFNLEKFPNSNVKVYAKFDVISYNITFDLNGATGENRVVNVNYDQDLLAIKCEGVLRGYKFVGWNTKSDGTGTTYSINKNLKNISTEDITLYAIWEQIEYTLTINLNNDKEDVVRILHYNDVIEKVEDPIKENSEFVGWFTYENKEIVEFSFDNATMPDYDLTIFAKYQGEVAIVFIVDEISYQTIMGHENEEITTEIIAPTKDGYMFGGWYLDSNFEQAYNLESFPTKDTNVYGKWEANTITVNFNGNGSTKGEMVSQEIIYNSNTPLNKNVFERTGYTFIGWDANQNASIPTYIDGYAENIVSNGEVTLYAIWKQNNYTVTINLNNGQEDIVKTLHYDDLIGNVNDPLKEGYKFIGWYLANGQNIDLATYKMPNDNIIIHAEYLKGVQISFIVDGLVKEVLTGYETENISSNPSNPTKTGYTFKGWYLDGEFNEEYNLETFPSENISIYGKLEANNIVVKFDGNGSTSGSMANQIITYDSNTPLNKNGYIRTGYTFIGWNTDKSAITAIYTDEYNENIISDGEVTLYAIWSKITYTITFNSNNHGETPASLKGVTELPSVLPVLIEEGYIFIGWYYDGDLTKLACVNDVITSNVTLYAKWEEEKVEPTPTEPIVDDIIYDDFQIHFLELGNDYTGDSTYIKAGDVDILIDAGSRTGSATTIKSYVDKYCTDGVLEYVIATHADQDHIAGFVGNASGSTRTGILYQYEVETIIDFAITTKTTQVYNNYVTARTYAINNGAKHYTAAQCFNETDGAKAVYELTDNISMKILYNYYYFNKSSDENNFSVCTLFTYNDHNFMFTGDLEEDGEEKLAAYYDGSTSAKTLPQVELFKAGHHGSKTSSNDCLLKLIQPKIVCVCCCAGGSEYTSNYQNTFPTQDMISRVAKYTDRVYVTTIYDEKALTYKSLNGNIIISSNGKTVGVSATNNIIKLKDSTWFNETIYVDSRNNCCSGKGKKDFYTSATSGTRAVPRRVWPS